MSIFYGCFSDLLWPLWRTKSSLRIFLLLVRIYLISIGYHCFSFLYDDGNVTCSYPAQAALPSAAGSGPGWHGSGLSGSGYLAGRPPGGHQRDEPEQYPTITGG